LVLFSLRYDLRTPPFSKATPAERCATAIAQCEWAEAHGFESVTLSEHHGSPDGYLPSPLVLAAAIAARTRRLSIRIGALVAPLHDPIRVAEDLAMVDLVSNGRLQVILGAGYRPSEFATFGKKLADRGAAIEETVTVLEKAWTGEPFEHRGTTVRVLPRPVQRPRPPIMLGGSSAAAARRAARIADYFAPTEAHHFEAYREERVRLGHPDPGPMLPALGSFVHVAKDPDEAWERIAPHAMHEMNSYGQWAAESGVETGYRPVSCADELRETGLYPVLTPDELVSRVRSLGPASMVILHPLMGGMEPELGWESLRMVADEVLPALRQHGEETPDA
jgi:alkanesulfonate monooxygenase SsuD/methylene tetrahydromethanopterin reductase-like flavin-dependent oxidoreductase (luciferase family)